MIGESKRTESALPDIERECEAWDWARTAGVSAEELREAVQVLAGSDDPKRRAAEAVWRSSGCTICSPDGGRSAVRPGKSVDVPDFQ